MTSLINKSSTVSQGKNVYKLKPANLFSVVMCIPIDGTTNNISLFVEVR